MIKNNNEKKITLIFLTIGILLSCLLTSCFKPDIKVALSKGKGSEHYENYEKWLMELNSDIEYIDLYHIDRDEALKILRDCSGIVLTGGPDVHPEKYGKGYDTARCEIDLKRDSLEFEIIKLARELNLPMLAICRGEQILNVAYGGSLIVDIPSDFDSLVTHRCEDPKNCFHKVMVVGNTLLSELCGISYGEVNSNHHQGVNRLAEVFVASAYARDGLIEAYEWKDKKNNPFLLAVQWHPERMDTANQLSNPIGKKFIQEVYKFYKFR
ncbi:MAG: gamma-glutamyl-gamma-aminobutyrate hydrolase family protein [bacterium]